MTRAITEPADLDGRFRDVDEPSDVPPAPSRPAEIPVGLAIAAQTPGWTPVTARDVDDIGLLPQEVRMLRGDVRDLAKDIKTVISVVETLSKQVLPLLADHGARIAAAERRQEATEERIAKLERDWKSTIDDVAKLKKSAATRARK